MKLDLVNGFVMRSPLELTQEYPIGLLTGDSLVGKTTLIKMCCPADNVHNVLYCGRSLTDMDIVAHPKVMYRGTKTKELFSKVEEVRRFSTSSGLTVPTLIVFDGLSEETWKDLNFQMDLQRLVTNTGSNFYVMFIGLRDTAYAVTKFTELFNLPIIRYEILRDAEKRVFTRIHNTTIHLEDDARVMCATSMDVLQCANILVNEAHYIHPLPYIDDNAALTRLYDAMERKLDSLAMDRRNEPYSGLLVEVMDGTVFAPIVKFNTGTNRDVFVIRCDSGSFDYERLEHVLRLMEEARCYFILVGGDLPSFIAMFVSETF